MLVLFFEGAALGFAISAPVGPINLLCMRRSLTHGKRIGFLTGLGAATGDAFYGAVAAFGLTAISDFFIHFQGYFQLFGGVLFFAMAVKLLGTRAPDRDIHDTVKILNGRTAFVSTLFLTMTNPATIIAFLTAFASIKFGRTVTADGVVGGWLDPLAITIGVFSGSAAWWLILSQISATFGTKLSNEALTKINKGAGVLLIIFAAVLLWNGIKAFV